MAARTLPPPLRLWRLVSLVDLPAMLVGGVAATFRHRWGGYVLLANLVLQIGSHLFVGRLAYRDVVSRAWPRVEPLRDDDWDD